MAATKNNRPRITTQRVVAAGARSAHFFSTRASLRSSFRVFSIVDLLNPTVSSRMRDETSLMIASRRYGTSKIMPARSPRTGENQCFMSRLLGEHEPFHLPPFEGTGVNSARYMHITPGIISCREPREY